MAKKYSAEFLKEISFPLGGIGTGSVGLAGNGRFVDWQIANRPNVMSTNGFTHIAVKAERKGSIIDSRVLQGILCPLIPAVKPRDFMEITDLDRE